MPFGLFVDLNQLQTAILQKVNYTYLTYLEVINSVKIFLGCGTYLKKN